MTDVFTYVSAADFDCPDDFAEELKAMAEAYDAECQRVDDGWAKRGEY